MLLPEFMLGKKIISVWESNLISYLGNPSMTNISWCRDIRGGRKPHCLRQREIFLGFSPKMETVKQCCLRRKLVGHSLECQPINSSEASL